MSDDRLNLAATVDLQAAADAEKPAKISILAYSGEPMRVSAFGTVVVEIAGVELPSSIPLLADHNADLASVAGTGSPSADGKSITVAGTLSRSSAAGQTIIALSRDGVQLQASVGLSVVASQFIPEAESLTANGRTFRAPAGGLRHITKSRLAEVSIVAIAADPNTSVAVKATQPKAQTMTDTTTTPTDTLTAEKTRISDINAKALELMRSHPHASDKIEAAAQTAIQAGVDASAAKVALYDSVQVDLAQFGSRHARRDAGSSQQVLTASLMLRSGHEDVAVKSFGEQTVEAARRARITNLVDLAAAALKADLRDPGQFENRDAMLKAAFSTTTLPTVLSNVIGRTLESAYSEAAGDWRSFCHIANAADFRDQKSIRPSALETAEKLGPGGEIKHSTIKEEDVYDWRVDTYSKMVAVTRTQIVNDDLGLFSDMPVMLAQSAARAFLDLLWSTILAGQSAGFFSTSNLNLAEAGSALGIASLQAAVSAMKSQRDSRGNDLSIRPAVLVVAPGLEFTARTLLNSSEIATTTGTDILPNGNPVRGIVSGLVVEPRLANTEKFAGAAAASWYLFGRPSDRGVTCGFLNGRMMPTVEIQEASFDRLGIQMRAYHDFGVALSDHRACYKATGAAAEGG